MDGQLAPQASHRPEPLGQAPGVQACATPIGLPKAYESLSLVHEGPHTEIWKVRCRDTGQLLAVKRLRPDWRNDQVSLILLKNEYWAAERVQSPYVVRLVDADLDCERPFLVTEWIAGSTLANRLRHEGPFSIPSTLWIARQWVLGMYDLEKAGFAHGDIRPANVMRADSGECKLIDLAHAKPLREELGLLHNDFLIGCTDYMSPERFLDGTPQPIITDLYSLGLSLYQLLSGQLPFAETSVVALMRQKRESEAASLGESRADAPRELVDLVDSLLSKRPIQRPGSLKKLARVLVSLELATQRCRTCVL